MAKVDWSLTKESTKNFFKAISLGIVWFLSTVTIVPGVIEALIRKESFSNEVEQIQERLAAKLAARKLSKLSKEDLSALSTASALAGASETTTPPVKVGEPSVSDPESSVSRGPDHAQVLGAPGSRRPSDVSEDGTQVPPNSARRGSNASVAAVREDGDSDGEFVIVDAETAPGVKQAQSDDESVTGEEPSRNSQPGMTQTASRADLFADGGRFHYNGKLYNAKAGVAVFAEMQEADKRAAELAPNRQDFATLIQSGSEEYTNEAGETTRHIMAKDFSEVLPQMQAQLRKDVDGLVEQYTIANGKGLHKSPVKQAYDVVDSFAIRSKTKQRQQELRNAFFDGKKPTEAELQVYIYDAAIDSVNTRTNGVVAELTAYAHDAVETDGIFALQTSLKKSLMGAAGNQPDKGTVAAPVNPSKPQMIREVAYTRIMRNDGMQSVRDHFQVLVELEFIDDLGNSISNDNSVSGQILRERSENAFKAAMAKLDRAVKAEILSDAERIEIQSSLVEQFKEKVVTDFQAALESGMTPSDAAQKLYGILENALNSGFMGQAQVDEVLAAIQKNAEIQDLLFRGTVATLVEQDDPQVIEVAAILVNSGSGALPADQEDDFTSRVTAELEKLLHDKQLLTKFVAEWKALVAHNQNVRNNAARAITGFIRGVAERNKNARTVARNHAARVITRSVRGIADINKQAKAEKALLDSLLEQLNRLGLSQTQLAALVVQFRKLNAENGQLQDKVDEIARTEVVLSDIDNHGRAVESGRTIRTSIGNAMNIISDKRDAIRNGSLKPRAISRALNTLDATYQDVNDIISKLLQTRGALQANGQAIDKVALEIETQLAVLEKALDVYQESEEGKKANLSAGRKQLVTSREAEINAAQEQLRKDITSLLDNPKDDFESIPMSLSLPASSPRVLSSSAVSIRPGQPQARPVSSASNPLVWDASQLPVMQQAAALIALQAFMVTNPRLRQQFGDVDVRGLDPALNLDAQPRIGGGTQRALTAPATLEDVTEERDVDGDVEELDADQIAALREAEQVVADDEELDGSESDEVSPRVAVGVPALNLGALSDRSVTSEESETAIRIQQGPQSARLWTGEKVKAPIPRDVTPRVDADDVIGAGSDGEVDADAEIGGSDDDATPRAASPVPTEADQIFAGSDTDEV